MVGRDDAYFDVNVLLTRDSGNGKPTPQTVRSTTTSGMSAKHLLPLLPTSRATLHYLTHARAFLTGARPKTASGATFTWWRSRIWAGRSQRVRGCKAVTTANGAGLRWSGST